MARKSRAEFSAAERDNEGRIAIETALVQEADGLVAECPQDEEDLAAEFFLAVINDDLAILRRFRGESSCPQPISQIIRADLERGRRT